MYNEGARVALVIVAGNGRGDPCSHFWWDWLYITNTFGKGMNLIITPLWEDWIL